MHRTGLRSSIGPHVSLRGEDDFDIHRVRLGMVRDLELNAFEQGTELRLRKLAESVREQGQPGE